MKLRFGVIGLGGQGAEHVMAINSFPEEMELAAVCDTVPGRLDEFPDSVRRFTDPTECLENADLDAVVLTLPHHLHADLAIKAMKNGKHVLVEKPMARTPEECRAMNEAAAKHGRLLMVAQNWRYTPWCIAFKRIVESGELGPIRMVRSEWLLNYHSIFPRESWIYDYEKAGGGAVIGLAVHNLDFLRFLFGEVETVFASSLTTDPWTTGPVENWTTAQMTFESGMIGQLLTGHTPYNGQDGIVMNVYGEEGTLKTGPQGAWVSSAQRSSQPAHAYSPYEKLDVAPYSAGMHEHPKLNQVAHFASCIRSGERPISDGTDNLNTIRLIQAIYESARTGKPVKPADM